MRGLRICHRQVQPGLRQKFCFPFRNTKSGEFPCNPKNWNNGKANRECLRFKRVYALRSECERYNSRFKASGQDRLWVRNANSAANLNTIAHIAALAVPHPSFQADYNRARQKWQLEKASRQKSVNKPFHAVSKPLKMRSAPCAACGRVVKWKRTIPSIVSERSTTCTTHFC